RRDIQESARIGEETEQAEQQLWKQLAGESLDMMLTDRSFAERCLLDRSTTLRLAALFILSGHWGLSHNNALECERLAVEDTDQEVVSMAVTCLGGYYAKTNDLRIGRLLATFVQNKTLAPQVRAVSHNALLKIRGVPISNWPPYFTNALYYSNCDQYID